MGQNESLNNTFNDYVYEGLVRYNKQFVPEPALATSWTQLDATTWRFVLRRNVRFHDGTPMTADDVVFSFERIQKPASNMKIYAQGVKEVRKVDDYTVDMILDGRTRCCCASSSTRRS
jgi:peptide/nickel transport system substrate-binding protein